MAGGWASRAGAPAALLHLARGTALALNCLAGAGAAIAQPASASPAQPAAASTAPGGGGGTAADAAEAAEEAKDEILVTANRQHGAVVTDVPPEVRLNSTAVKALGAADIEEVLADIAPEIRIGRADRTDRSARAEQMPILLVDGQRIAGFSAIRDLPPEAIRRIEVFPEKVALQYGYAADQRVVNIVLRTRYRALTVLGRYTLAPEHWRGIYRAKADLLRIGVNGHWNLDLDYRHEDPIFADDTIAGAGADPAAAVPRHTLAAQDDHLSLSGDMARTIGTVSAELAARLELDALQSRLGLSDEDGDLLAQQGLAALATGPQGRIDRTVDAQASLTLNGRVDGWRWSFIGKLDDRTRETRTGEDVRADGFDTILLPSPALLGRRCGNAGGSDCAATSLRVGSGDLFLNGSPFRLPAGPVTVALRGGASSSLLHADSAFAAGPRTLSRGEVEAQGNIDVPLSAANAGALGKLSAGFNGEVRHLSDFGTLSTLGTTLEWSPTRAIDILASARREEQAPTLLELGEAALVTPELREYDFSSAQTAIVQRTQGGDPGLRAPTARIATARLQVKPLRAADLALSAEYRIEDTRNAVTDLSAATPALEAAFPSRFARDAQGHLIAIDESPVNLARRDRQQLRWGVNYSTAFGRPRPAATAGKAPLRDQLQIALYDTWHLQDSVLPIAGQQRLDLLGRDTLGDRGGTPAHEIELESTLAMAAWSATINADWQAETSARAGPLPADRLSFSQGVKLNLRLQLNLAYQPWVTHFFPRARGSLNLSVDNLLGAETRVHDRSGAVPLAYREAYLNATGRTFRLTLRKRFR